MSTAQTTHLQAELALAAYSVLRKGPTGLAENLRALQGDGRGLTVKQAEEFAQRYPEVVVQVNDAGSGLSMTVFRGVDGGVALAIRGSEPELADWLPTNVNIAINGAGYQQIVALYNAWQRLTHLHGESITVYDVDLSNSANPVVARTVVNDLGTAQAPLVSPGAAVDVAGHSLGGHLAMAFAGLFPINARQVHAFSAPGFTDSTLNRTFFARLGGQLPVGTSPAGVPTVNVIADAQSGEGQSFSPVAGLHSRPGMPLDIAIENQALPTDEPSPVSGIWNHSQMVLTDSLAVYDLLSQLSQGLGTAEYKAILNQSVRGTAASYERVIDALEALFGANREWLPAGNAERDDLYRAIYALQGNSLFVSLSGQLWVLPSGAADALANAQQIDAEGLAYRYALKELNPFVVAGSAALYVPHNASGELELFVDAASTPAGMTEGYLADRAQMLEFLMLGNTNDTAAFASNQVAGQVLYRDLALRSVAESSDGKPTEVNVYLTGGTPNPRGPNTRTIGFGTNTPDVLQGRDNADRLYGGQGADLLAGGKGDDYLEGGAALDVYLYSGKRPFLGEPSNDGADEILDTDGKGVIRYTFTQGGLLSDTVQSTVIGGAGIKVSDTEWRSPDGRFTYLRQISGLRVAINGDAGGSLFIQGFDFDKAQAEGQFGIKLLEAAAWPSFAALPLPQTQGQPILGDLEPLVQTGSVPALKVSDNPPTWVPDLSGHPDWRLKAIIDVATGSAGPVSFTIEYYQADANGNLIRTSTPAPGLNFFLYDSAGNDSINAGSGNNFVFATRGGDDWIVALDGDDTVTDSGGNNRIEVGNGANTVRTGTGNDHIVTGEGPDTIEDAGGTNRIDAGGGDDIVSSGDGDDWIAGGAGDDSIAVSGGANLLEGGPGRDYIRGGDGSDAIEGGTDADLLYGGAGNDQIWGDIGGDLLGIAQGIALGETGPPQPGQGDLLSGEDGNDVLIGSAKADYLAGGADRDIIAGGAGDDTIYGDGVVFAAPYDWSVIRTVDDSGPTAMYIVTRSAGFVGADVPGAADTIYGGAGADWIFAGGGGDYVEGGSGDDVILGEGGSDILSGGDGRDILDGDSLEANELGTFGDDFLDGGAGDDVLFGGNGNDVLFGGAGDDQLLGGEGDDLLYGGLGTDVLQGGPGRDNYVYFRGDGVDVVIDPDITTESQYRSALSLGPGIAREQVKFRLGSLMIDLGEGDAIHFAGFDPDDPESTPVLGSIQFADGAFMSYRDVLEQGFDLDGTDGDDYIKGTAVTDRIDAKGGNDIIEAGVGDDHIITGAGADIVFGGAGNDRFVAGDGDLIIDLEGANTLDLTDYAGLTQANLEITQYRAPDGDLYLNFHVRDDLNPGVTPATGGVSVQYGEIGNFASVTVSDGAEGTAELSYETLMAEYAGHGLIYSGTAAPEMLIGTPYADTFFGGAGADTIRAGAGDDRVDGGAGDDTLEGGAGDDTYLLGYNRGRDTVIEDGQAEPNSTHTILLDAGIAPSLVHARRSGDDLEVRLRATADALVLKDFYLQPQSWQDGWQVRDSSGALSDLAGYLTVVPPQAASWLEEEEAAFRARREQVFAANRLAEGYSALGDNVFQMTEQAFDYAGASVGGSTTTLALDAHTLTSNGGEIDAGVAFTSTPIGSTSAVVGIGLPVVRGAAGERAAASAHFGASGSSGSASPEFIPLTRGGGGGIALGPGDVAVPVYGPTFGSARGLVNAGSSEYADSGAFNNSTQWTLVGYNVYRSGSATAPGSIEAVATYQNYDQRLAVQDVRAGSADNVISASSAVVAGGAGDDAITLEGAHFFAGPDWEGASDLAGLADPLSPSVAQRRYLSRLPGLLGEPLRYPARANLLGSFASGDDGNDTLAGSPGQDVLAGGHGADEIDGRGGSDRVLVGATDSGVDALADSGFDSLAYLDHFYWSRGILNWDERAAHGNEWRMDADGGEHAYFASREDALASLSYGTPVFIAPLPMEAPVLTRDDPLHGQLVAAGVLSEDVLEFGPGLSLQDLQISVEVDPLSAQDHPERPWVNGGRVSIRWGADGGVDFDLGRLDGNRESVSLLSGGWVRGREDGQAPDGSWAGYRLGEGFESFRFADGTTLGADALLAHATVNVRQSEDYEFRRDSGYQLIDRRFASIRMADGIAASEVLVTRDGFDLLVSVFAGDAGIGAQGRIRDWYASGTAAPAMSLLFDFDAAVDAAQLATRGLEVRGTFRADTLIGLHAFADRLLGEGGDDLLFGSGGDDLLAGGAGNDYLDGGTGKDTYLFNVGDGADLVADFPSGASDPEASVIMFGEEIQASQIRFSLGSLVLHYGAGDTIRFTAFNADDPHATPVFERLEFADGSTIFYEELLENGFTLHGTDGDDVVDGTSLGDQISGYAGNDTLSSRGGNDTLSGGDGNDVLQGGAGRDDLYGGEGDDTLSGGPGDNDSLAGEGGADTYLFAPGDGRDDIFEWDETLGVEDRVLLQGFEASSVRVTRDPWSYYLVMGGGDRLMLANMAAAAEAVVERIEFEDGTIWTPAELAARVELLAATEGEDILWGTAGADTIRGLGGYDELYGNQGEDFLAGGEGEDFYYFAAGDGHDTVDNLDADGSYDSIFFADAAAADAVLTREGASLVITLGAESVALAGWYLGPDYRIDSVHFAGDGGYWDAATIALLAPTGDNSPPRLATPLADLSFEAGTSFSFAVPAGTFVDDDPSDTLALSASRYDGAALPAWLSFDPAAAVFSGTAAIADLGISHILVTAVDSAGASVQSDFALVVRVPAGMEATGTAGDDVIFGGTGDETLTAKGGSDYLYGDVGNDLLKGGGGNDVLQGWAGNDVLRGGKGQNVLDGGAGDDLIFGGQGSAFIVGGAGNDTLRVGSGNDVIAFNAGDGMDTIHGGKDGGNTLSFGGGIRYSDLAFSKSGKDLVVSTGAGEGVTLKNWYGGNHSVLSLQIVLDATEEFDAGSSDPLYNRRVQTFDFLGMVSAYDAARAETPGITSWEITNALLAFHLSGADDTALGGDLAYWYGRNRSLQGISLQAAQEVIGAPGFGAEAQSLRPFSGLQEGFVKLT